MPAAPAGTGFDAIMLLGMMVSLSTLLWCVLLFDGTVVAWLGCYVLIILSVMDQSAMVRIPLSSGRTRIVMSPYYVSLHDFGVPAISVGTRGPVLPQLAWTNAISVQPSTSSRLVAIKRAHK